MFKIALLIPSRFIYTMFKNALLYHLDLYIKCSKKPKPCKMNGLVYTCQKDESISNLGVFSGIFFLIHCKQTEKILIRPASCKSTHITDTRDNAILNIVFYLIECKSTHVTETSVKAILNIVYHLIEGQPITVIRIF